MSEDMRAIMLQQQLDEVNMLVVYLKTAMRNALTELDEGDIDAAIETLKQFA